MLKALQDTINPKGGKGVMETFIFIIMAIIVIGAIILNLTDHAIDPLIQTIATGLMGYIGYMVGSNKTNEKKEDVDE